MKRAFCRAARRLRGRRARAPPGALEARARDGPRAGSPDRRSRHTLRADRRSGPRRSRPCDLLTARSLDGRDPRYINLRLPSPLLGLEQVRRAGASAAVVTEGPFDWLTLCAWRLPGVALLGTRASREALAALRSLGRVYLALDADDPVRLATARLASALEARATVVPLPGGAHDLSELGRRRDADRVGPTGSSRWGQIRLSFPGVRRFGG